MKRPINFFDGFVLLLLVSRLLEIGKPFPLWYLLVPYALELIWSAAAIAFRFLGGEESLTRWWVRKIVSWKTKQETRKILQGKK